MDAKQSRQVYDALLSAFRSRSSLAMMLLHRLGWKLDEIASEANLANTLFEVIAYAERRDLVNELLAAAQAENPNNPQLQAASSLAVLAPPASATTSATTSATPLNLIISHATRDTATALELESMLDVLVARKKLNEPWREQNIPPGTIRKYVIDERWRSADVIVLLISADFLATHQDDLDRAKQASTRVSIIPVLLRPCGWEYTWLGEEDTGVLLLPRRDGKLIPLSACAERSEAWHSVLNTIVAVTRARGA